MRAALATLLLLLPSCHGKQPAEPAGNDAQRQTQLLENQAQAIQREAQSNVTAAEQALENEGAAIFANREALLNENTDNAASAQTNAAATDAGSAAAAPRQR